MVYRYDYKYQQSKGEGTASVPEKKQGKESGGSIFSRRKPYGYGGSKGTCEAALCFRVLF